MRTILDRQIRGFEQVQAGYRDLTVVLPSLTVDSSLVLYRGGGQLGTDWRVVAARRIVGRRVIARTAAGTGRQVG
ncbi:MAG: hypothetical protein AABY85_11600 [Gemmatimonadota bacterium]